MAISQSNTVTGNNVLVTELIAATADTSYAIPHPFGAAPAGVDPAIHLDVTFTPLNADGAKLSGWFIKSQNSTSVTVQKATTSLSGGASPQVRVRIRRPHSIVT